MLFPQCCTSDVDGGFFSHNKPDGGVWVQRRHARCKHFRETEESTGTIWRDEGASIWGWLAGGGEAGDIANPSPFLVNLIILILEGRACRFVDVINLDWFEHGTSMLSWFRGRVLLRVFRRSNHRGNTPLSSQAEDDLGGFLRGGTRVVSMPYVALYP